MNRKHMVLQQSRHNNRGVIYHDNRTDDCCSGSVAKETTIVSTTNRVNCCEHTHAHGHKVNMKSKVMKHRFNSETKTNVASRTIG